MKLRLPHALFRAVMACLVPCAVHYLSPLASAAVLHSSPTIQEYTDIAEGRGIYRFANGVSLIIYQNGEATSQLAHTPTFTATCDAGYFTLVNNGSFQLTVGHNGIMSNETFSGRYVGQYAQKYSGVGIRGVNSFSSGRDGYATTENSNIPTGTDYRVERVSRLATDATSAAWCTDTYQLDRLHPYYGNTLLYRVGGGVSVVENQQGATTELSSGYYGLTAGITPVADNYSSGNIYSLGFRFDGSADCSESNPLPSVSLEGDSGSPVYFYNESTGQFELVGVLQGYQSGRGDDSVTQYNPVATQDTIDYMKVDVTANGETIYLAGATEGNVGQTITDGDYTAILYQGTITQGDQVTKYNGVALDVFAGGTWRAMSEEMYNSNTWYTYADSDLINISNDAKAANEFGMKDLFYTHSLRFVAETGSQVIELSDDVDLGVGYMQYSLGEGQTSATFELGKASSDNSLSTAGFIVDKGVTLNNYLTYELGRELRRVGEGVMNIVGTGNNNVLLNIGGGGLTYLNREEGYYGAYNVFVGTGATLRLADSGQVKHNVTLGAGGGTLDLHGNDYNWSAAEGNADGHFSLTVYEGVNRVETSAIANHAAGTVSTVTISRDGNFEFAGAFRDGSTYTQGSSIEGDSRYTMMPSELIGSYTQYTASALNKSNSVLKVVYSGSGTMTMTGVYTLLAGSNEQGASGLEVASGKVLLQGTNTIHALGAEDGTNTDRLHVANDWHYAMAEMNVQVDDGATFELGHHALLLGNVSVAAGGNYVMRQAVNERYECVEGWYIKEDTSALADYYGHKGNVSLAKGASMTVRFDDGVTTTLNLKDCKISGEGTFTVERGTVQANLSDNLKVGKIVLSGGSLVFDNSGAIATGHNIEIDGTTSSLTLRQWSNLNASSITLRNGGTLYTGNNGFGNDGGTLTVDGSGSIKAGNAGEGNIAAAISGKGTLLVSDWDAASKVNMKGVVSDADGGTLALQLNHTNLHLEAASTYSGGTTIQGGTVTTHHANALGSGSITMTAGTLSAETTLNVKQPMTFSGNNAMAVTGSLNLSTPAENSIIYSGKGATVISADITNSTNRMGVTVASANKGNDFVEMTLSGVIGTQGTNFGINKYGEGTLKLEGANKFAWGFQLHKGRVIAASESAFGVGSLDVKGGTTLEVAKGTYVNLSHYLRMEDNSQLLLHSLKTDDAVVASNANGGYVKNITLTLAGDIELTSGSKYMVISGVNNGISANGVTVNYLGDGRYTFGTSAESNTLYLTATQDANTSLVWSGTAESGTWNQAATNQNWSTEGAAESSFMNLDRVSFTDEAANKKVTVAAEGVKVASLEVSAAGYHFSGGAVQTQAATLQESVTLEAGASVKLGESYTVSQKAVSGESAVIGPVEMGAGYIHGQVEGGLATFDNALIDIAKGVTLEMKDVLLTETSRITDDPATVSMENVTIALGEANAVIEGSSSLLAGTTLVEAASGYSLNLAESASVLSIFSSALDTVEVTGTSLTLDLNGLASVIGDAWQAHEYVAISFGLGQDSLAHFDTTGLSISASYGGASYAVLVNGGDQASATTLYVATASDAIPEPTTTTLSLLALSLLVARRRRQA